MFINIPMELMVNIFQYLSFKELLCMQLVCRETYYCTKRSNVIYHLFLNKRRSFAFSYLIAGYKFKELTVSNDAYNIFRRLFSYNISFKGIKKIMLNCKSCTWIQFEEIIKSVKFSNFLNASESYNLLFVVSLRQSNLGDLYNVMDRLFYTIKAEKILTFKTIFNMKYFTIFRRTTNAPYTITNFIKQLIKWSKILRCITTPSDNNTTKTNKINRYNMEFNIEVHRRHANTFENKINRLVEKKYINLLSRTFNPESWLEKFHIEISD